MFKKLVWFGLLLLPCLAMADSTTYYFDVGDFLQIGVAGDTVTVHGLYDSTDFSVTGGSLTITYDGHTHSTGTVVGDWPLSRITGGSTLVTPTTNVFSLANGSSIVTTSTSVYKLANAGDLLTGTTQFAGDVTGTYGATVVGNNSHTHNDTTVSISTAGLTATGAGDYLKKDNTWTTPTVGDASTLAGLTTTYLLTPSNMLDGSFGSTVRISSITVGAVVPAVVAAGTYSNITLPTANIAAGSLGTGVLAPLYLPISDATTTYLKLAEASTTYMKLSTQSSLITNTTSQSFVVSIDSATPQYLGAIDLDLKTIPYAITITTVVFRCNSGTVTGVGISWASDTTFVTSETSIGNAVINVPTGNTGFASFSDNTIPADSCIILKSTGTTGSPSKLWGKIYYTKD